MNTTVLLIIISGIALLIAFAFIAIRILLLKNGRFKGTCSSNNPYLANQDGSCSMCGRKPAEGCAAEEDSSKTA